MPSQPLPPDTRLGIRLSAIMSRNQYAQDPGPVLAELLAVADGRDDILAAEAGRWIGFYEDDYTATLANALRTLPLDMDDAINLGRSRRFEGHRMNGYAQPPGVDSLPTTGYL